MVPCRRSDAVPLGWGEQEDVGGLHHQVGTSPINPIATFPANYITRKCSYACSYLLFISIIVFFSLPPITVAINISNSAPTQCGPFQVTWDHDTMAPSFYILPLNDRPVIGDNSTTFDSQAMTWNYTLNKLPLKIGTQFVVSLRYPGALFSSPPEIYEIGVLT